MFVRSRHLPRGRQLVLVTAVALSLPGLPLSAASGDSKPVLISTARGQSGGWASLAELRKAAEQHNPKACAEYGAALLRGEDGAKQDVALAMMFLHEAATAGEPNAQFRLGKIYDDGEFAPQDYAKAFEYYSAAAKVGVPEAQYNLGVMYSSARGTKRDFVEGLAWLIVATKNGAGGDGEQKTREHLTQTKQQKQIAAAEQRAAAILKDPAAAASNAGPVTAESIVPKKTQAPARVDLGDANSPAKANVAAPAALPPSFSPSLAPVPPPPPSRVEVPAVGPTIEDSKNSSGQK